MLCFFIILSLVLLVAIVVICIRYRREIRRKNSGIFRQLTKERELKEKLKREKIEKETLMKVITKLKIEKS